MFSFRIKINYYFDIQQTKISEEGSITTKFQRV